MNVNLNAVNFSVSLEEIEQEIKTLEERLDLHEKQIQSIEKYLEI